jgi:hypothetical protein
MENYSLSDVCSAISVGDSVKIKNEKIIIFDVSPNIYNPHTFEPMKRLKIFKNLNFQIEHSFFTTSIVPYKFLSTRILLLEINYKKKC